eukprot:PhF_6_TR29109/c0_g2_i1/m.42467
MSIRSIITLTTIVGLCIISSTDAWGPVAHSLWACNALPPSPQSNLSSCMEATTDPSYNALRVGSDLPDAFYFGSDWDGTSGNCSGLQYVHDDMFASWMAYDVLTNTPSSKSVYNMALGFLAHVLGDATGFSPNGYFTGSRVGGGIPRWIPTWAYMSSLDSMIAQSMKLSPKYSYLDSTTIQYFANATRQYSAVAGPFPPLTPDLVQMCVEGWIDGLQLMVADVTARPPAVYQQQIVYYDAYNRTNVQDIAEDVAVVGTCVQGAIRVFVDSVLQNRTSYSYITAYEKAMRHMWKQQQIGKCGGGNSTKKTLK